MHELPRKLQPDENTDPDIKYLCEQLMLKRALLTSSQIDDIFDVWGRPTVLQSMVAQFARALGLRLESVIMEEAEELSQALESEDEGSQCSRGHLFREDPGLCLRSHEGTRIQAGNRPNVDK